MVIVIDDAKISQFLVVSEELVMVMMTMMPRFVGFLPIKSTNLVTGDGDDGDGDDGDGDSDDDAKICWFLAYKIHKSCCLWRDGAVQQDLLFYWLYFGDRLYLWEYIIAYPQENISPRFVANIYCWFITNNKCGYIAYNSTNIVI